MILPCLSLSNIRYISRVKWSTSGKGVAPSLTSWCSSYLKGSLLVVLNYGPQLTLIFNPLFFKQWIYIYMCVRVCVCVCVAIWDHCDIINFEVLNQNQKFCADLYPLQLQRVHKKPFKKTDRTGWLDKLCKFTKLFA